MSRVVEFQSNGAAIQIVTEEAATPGASQRASTGSTSTDFRKITAPLGLDEATRVVGELSDAFSRSLASAAKRPNDVEVTFGLEASGEFGNFLISKISGKANFSVKLSWKFE